MTRQAYCQAGNPCGSEKVTEWAHFPWGAGKAVNQEYGSFRLLWPEHEWQVARVGDTEISRVATQGTTYRVGVRTIERVCML
jgi:hypothetical protein